MKQPIIPREELSLLSQIHKFSNKNKVGLFVVGGYIRDILIHRKKISPDIDFCLSKNAIGFSRKLSKKIGGGFVVLDKEHGCSRIVKKIGGKIITLDFADFRAKTLGDDLAKRDFTINCIAISLGDLLSDVDFFGSLIDPLDGRKDIGCGIIRIANNKSFHDDPLRVLRAFSFLSMLGFKIDKKTTDLIRKEYKLLSTVSFERIRDELFKILESSGSYDLLKMLDKIKILPLIMPEIEPMRALRQGPYHHLDVLNHSFETVRQLEAAFGDFKRDNDVQAYLDKNISGGRSRRALLKLGCFLHDIGKPGALRKKGGKTIFHGHERIGWDITENIAKRLKLSNDELYCLRQMVFWHLRPGYLADNPVISQRAKFRYFRDTKDEAVSVLLLSIADQRSTRGPLTSDGERVFHEKTCKRLIKEYFRQSKERKPKKLVNGFDLIHAFKLQPSPLVGKILAQLEEMQALGKVSSKKEALCAAAKLIGQKKK